MERQYNLLLTVPHGFCPSLSITRECDLRALSAAKIIGNVYTEKTDKKYKLVYIPRKRSVVDLNRSKPVGGSEIWDEFNRRIKSKLHDKTLLLDVHSFPFGDFDGAQITILELSGENRSEVKNFVFKAIQETGLDVKLLKGKGNYIQDYYSKYSYPLLIEFCEDKDHLSNNDIKRFGEVLFSYFRKYV